MPAMRVQSPRNVTLHLAGMALALRTSRNNPEYTNPRDLVDIETTLELAHSIVGRYERLGVDPKGKRVLELGPGRDLSTGAVLLHHGAASYQAIDLFDNRTENPEALYAAIDEHYGRRLDPDALAFSQVTFPDLPEVTGQYDVIVSHATLEHIPDLLEVFAALRRVAAPGAVFVHHIDGMTHTRLLRERDPLNVLRYPNATWARIATYPGVPNRLRAGEYVDLARRAGWLDAEVHGEYVASAAYLERVTPSLAPAYRDRDDLGLLTFNLVAHA
jgi:SAM-dependent methyltransferase